MKRLFAALSLMLIATAGIACSGSDSGGEAISADAPDEGRAPGVSFEEAPMPASNEQGEIVDAQGSTTATGSLGSGGGGDDHDSSGGANRATGLPDIGPRVIKTATVGLEVKEDNLQETLQTATSAAEKYGGFVVSTSVSDDDEHPTGAIVVRVPASRFGDALADLEGLGKVTGETVSGQDVSQEYIDLDARLRNYMAQEVVLLRLMERATSVLDTIRVQNELQRVQLEVERLRGRLNYLDDQTAMSTIELRIAEEGAIVAPPGEFEKAWQRAQDGLVAVIAGIISSLGVIVPIGLLALIVVFVVGRLRPRATNPS